MMMSPNSCMNIQNVTVTVNPTPVVSQVNSVTYCTNSPGAAISFTTPTTGGAAIITGPAHQCWIRLSGTGNIPAFTAIDTGVTPVITTVTVYATINGCTSAAMVFNVTVNNVANAGTISGSPYVCIGSTTTLSTNGNPGGTWSSGNTSLATVDPVTGVVTGVATGNPSIFYTVSNNCGSTTASFTIAVDALPNAGTVTAVGGSNQVCVNNFLLLQTSGDQGGLWIAGNPSIANISNPTVGVVTGVSKGTAQIAYIASNVCGYSATQFTVVVNPLPNAGTISGSSSVCVGATVSLSTSGDANGTWSSSNTSLATVDPSTGVVTGVAPGNPTIYYNVSNMCGGPATAQFRITVNQASDHSCAECRWNYYSCRSYFSTLWRKQDLQYHSEWVLPDHTCIC